MTLAKSAVTGIVYRAPETGYSSNNVAVSTFVLDIGEGMLIRIIARRQTLNDVVATISKGDKVLVEGRLQTAVAKMDDGSEKRIYEIDAVHIEKFGENNSKIDNNEEIVKFESDDMANELISEDEIPF